jgi:multiple sugar transport system permease protein
MSPKRNETATLPPPGKRVAFPAPAVGSRRRSLWRHGPMTVVYAILIVYAITTVLPFVWLAGAAFKPLDEFNHPYRFIPHHPTLSNFGKAFSLVPFAIFFWNSVKISVLVTLGVVVTSACSGYAFARLRFPGRDRIFLCYLATLMVPWAVVMIPEFVLIKLIGWMDTHYSLVVPALFTAYGTFMLRQFFLGISTDYEDAARIDGCGPFGIFLHVVLPLSRPALTSLAIFTFIGSWNNLIQPLILIFSEDKFTLPPGLDLFRGMQGQMDWGALMAGAFCMLVPMLILFAVGQRFITRGIRIAVEKG